jgi:hypothetical protein
MVIGVPEVNIGTFFALMPDIIKTFKYQRSNV